MVENVDCLIGCELSFASVEEYVLQSFSVCLSITEIRSAFVASFYDCSVVFDFTGIENCK